MDSLLNLKGTYLIVPVMIILAIILVFIDSKINKDPNEDPLTTSDFLKGGLFAGIISFIVVYINLLDGNIHEEILTGPPGF